jgi:tRNA (guanine-N7-)-methyltransferase
MGRSKLQKIAEFNEAPNCLNAREGLAGTWAAHFGNTNPIILELGCGKGDLSVGLARLHPEINYIGVDLKGVRMWTGAQAALGEGLKNVAFLRCDIHAVNHYFAPGEVSGIWITFPDPFPKLKQTKNRMTNERFLRHYTEMLPPGGTVWFKTDNITLFDYTLAHFEELHAKDVFGIHIQEQTRDLHASPLKNEENGITTDYERRFLKIGKLIQYMRFTLAPGPNIGLIPATDRVALDSSERAPKRS